MRTSRFGRRTQLGLRTTGSAGVQPGPCKSNAISRMCGDKRFHICRKIERWSALNRSSRTGEGGRSIGWADEGANLSHVGTVSSRRW